MHKSGTHTTFTLQNACLHLHSSGSSTAEIKDQMTEENGIGETIGIGMLFLSLLCLGT
jgi:hypothetical protein